MSKNNINFACTIAGMKFFPIFATQISICKNRRCSYKLDCQDLNQKEDMIFRVVTEQLCVIMFVVMLLFGGLPPATARAAKTNE